MTEEKKPRGFATLTPERRREISTLGGKAAQASGRGHKFTAEEARAAGAKGGRATHVKKAATKMTAGTFAGATSQFEQDVIAAYSVPVVVESVEK
jgi:general stress protein YciG